MKFKIIRVLTEEEVVRFWKSVDRGGDCWSWRGPSSLANKVRYGVFVVPKAPRGLWTDKTMYKAHRVAWTLERGPIPARLTIDHLCRNTLCCNPAHMEVVTQSVNTLRAVRKGFCRLGHKMSEKGVCLVCARVRQKAWREKNPERASAIWKRYYDTKGRELQRKRYGKWRESIQILTPKPEGWPEGWKP